MATDILAEYSALNTFHNELHHLVDRIEHRVREAGLQGTKYRLMIAIKRQQPDVATIGGLAKELKLDRSTIVDLVDELSRQHFVVRERDRQDRRRFLISLTPAGEQWLRPLVEGDLRELASAGPDLLRALRTVLAHAVATTSQPRPQAHADIRDFAWRAVGAAPI